ncbi:branched-chain amino acid ABC transporter permease [Variovorax sp. J22P271]|uniref:branched-chain amino acid ABC transporter permease n=1 Tax=Variovorax davisae TaxID=3053515 RepID=UPI0025762A4B|nr:branched-chain amino acid ABC transporter permease [Variovorax sp. J22P271]MDM0033696.1 branched-chain amino acid ABC transporter permease [Variovorax sp. J22P271]
MARTVISSVDKSGLTVVASLTGVAALSPLLLSAYGVGVLTQLCAWVALAGSWVAFSGMTGYISLGHAVFFGLGAYIMALGWQQIPIVAILPLAGVAAAALALVVGYPALRVRGPYFVILTLGISEFLKYVVVAIEASLGAGGRLLIDTPDTVVLFYPMLGLALAATALNVWLTRSRLGAALRAIREDETAAATVGVPVTRIKMLAFAVSAVIPAMVGALSVLRSTYFEPMQLFSPTTSFTIVTMAIIGGSDRPAGPVLGAAFILFLSELLWARAPQTYMILLGALLIGFVLLAPSGLSGLWARRRSASLKRRAVVGRTA